MLALIGALMLSIPAMAQPMGGPDCGGAGCQGMTADGPGWQHFKEVRTKVMKDKVGLTDAEIQQVQALRNKGHQERMELRKQLGESMTRLKALLDEDSNDQNAYKAELDTMTALYQTMRDQRQEQMQKLRQILTPKKTAKMMGMMHRMHKGMKGMRGRHGKGHRGMGSGGTGAGPGTGGNCW